MKKCGLRNRDRLSALRTALPVLSLGGHELDKNVALMLRPSDISRRKVAVTFPFLRSWRSLLTISFEEIRDFFAKLSKALNPTVEIT
jgi:hypothetical protein